MQTPVLETKRLVLRRFTENDLPALYEIFSDPEVNTYLPWFPLKAKEEADGFYREHYEKQYRQGSPYHYAVCLKTDNHPVGYVNAENSGAYDFGYGLRREFWHRGIMSEAGEAVIRQLRQDGLPFITATHDVNNPRSGAVMQRLGMTYCYSYREQWMPKNFPVIFRMYQLSFRPNIPVYSRYWDISSERFTEEAGAAAPNPAGGSAPRPCDFLKKIE